MRTEVEWKGGLALLDLPKDESGFWRGVAEVMDGIDLPWKGDPDMTVSVRCPLGECRLTVKGRDSMFVDGVERPSPAIFPAAGFEDGIPGLEPAVYPERFLTFASAESAGGRGSYKFYRLFPENGRIGAEYGRIGQRSGFGAPRRVKDPYPAWMFWIKLKEKLMKGYADQSDVFLDPESAEPAAGRARWDVPDGATESERLYARLMAIAEGKLKKDLLCGTKVTVSQIRRSRELIQRMGSLGTVEAFNRDLLALLQVSPRTCAAVRRQMAESTGDFAAILAREQSLLEAMEAVFEDKSAEQQDSGRHPSFDDFGVEVRLAGDAERDEALSLLSRRLRAKARDVWAVCSRAQSESFEAWCSANRIGDVRLLWHGSPACNWASIVRSSLRVPAASDVAHGAMFGRGIYFGQNGFGKGTADEGGGEKSWGYAGAADSCWSRGASGRDAFMALFDVAYGKPLHPTHVGQYSQEALNGFDCVHAQAGKLGLANDEIVVYSASAVRIRYLVSFEA